MNSPTPANSTISIELARNLGALHAHDRALQEDVLASGQVGVEAGGDLDQRADAAAARCSGRGSACRIRVSSFRIVDLPAPFGPMMPSASPARTSNDTSLDRPELALGELRRTGPCAGRSAGRASTAPDRASCRDARRGGISSRRRRRQSGPVIQMFSANVNSARWKTTQAATNSDHGKDADAEERPEVAARRRESPPPGTHR